MYLKVGEKVTAFGWLWGPSVFPFPNQNRLWYQEEDACYSLVLGLMRMTLSVIGTKAVLVNYLHTRELNFLHGAVPVRAGGFAVLCTNGIKQNC